MCSARDRMKRVERRSMGWSLEASKYVKDIKYVKD